ncbi:MAG: endonuclease/exonuclease/phosphatase family protein [Planctomycetota bacterium]
MNVFTWCPVAQILLLGLLMGMADSSHAEDSATSARVRLCSYNIRLFNPGDGPDHWPNRADAVIQFLRQHDVVGLQEVTPQQMVQLTRRLSPEFTGYGVGRDDGKQRGEAAAIFYRSARFTADPGSTRWLSPTPDVFGSKGWDAALPRTFTMLHLTDKQTGKHLAVINTHFDHRGKIARSKSAELLVQQVEKQPTTLPVVLMGDFNCVPSSQPYQVLANSRLDDARLVAKVRQNGPPSTWNGFRAIQTGRIIDHLFVTPNVNTKVFQIRDPKTQSGRFASDHLPVCAEILIP